MLFLYIPKHNVADYLGMEGVYYSWVLALEWLGFYAKVNLLDCILSFNVCAFDG